MKWALSLIAVVACGAGIAVLPNSSDEAPVPEEVPWSEWQSLTTLSQRVTHEEVQEALAVLDPYGGLNAYLRVLPTEVHVRGPRGWFSVAFRASSLQRMQIPLRVILDPGHHGGARAKAEDRYFSDDLRTPIKEGNLNFATARLVESRLVEAGRTVSLTRSAPPTHDYSAVDEPEFDAQREAQFAQADSLAQRRSKSLPPWPTLLDWIGAGWWTTTVATPVGYPLFTRFDLRRRSALAKEDDVLVSIHYNAADDRSRNGVMTFVLGHYLPDELASWSQRYYAISHILRGLHRPSVDLARRIGLAMQQQMRLPVLAAGDHEVVFPNNTPLDTQAGVFARNLAVLRRAKSPAVLVEGPCMNVPDENLRLSSVVGYVDGVGYPQRAEEYAAAVLDGLQVNR